MAAIKRGNFKCGKLPGDHQSDHKDWSTRKNSPGSTQFLFINYFTLNSGYGNDVIRSNKSDKYLKMWRKWDSLSEPQNHLIKQKRLI